MNAFGAHYWNSMQLLAWVWLGDRHAVESASDDAPDRTHWIEVTLPDGRTECIETPSKPLSFEYATEWPRAGDGGVQEIREWCKRVPAPRLVVTEGPCRTSSYRCWVYQQTVSDQVL